MSQTSSTEEELVDEILNEIVEVHGPDALEATPSVNFMVRFVVRVAYKVLHDQDQTVQTSS